MLEYILMNTLFSLLTAVLLLAFLKVVFRHRVSKLQIVIFLLSFGLGNGVITAIWMILFGTSSMVQIIKPILIFILSIALIKYLLKVTWPKTVASFLSIMVATGLGNLATPIILNLFGLTVTTKTIGESITLYFFANITTYIISMLIICIIPALFRELKNLNPVSILFCVTLIIIIVSGQIYGLTPNVKAFQLELIVLVILYVLVLFGYGKHQKEQALKEEKRQQEFYNESLKDTLQKLRHFKHDYNNHFSTLNFMLSNNKYEEARNYVSELSGNVSNINTAIYNIENVALFAIISSKLDKAKKSNIKFNLQVVGVVNSIPELKVSELCAIIGIFLDNAIEAAEESRERTIDMSIISYQDCIEILISNSCDQAPMIKKINLDGYSTKGSERGHGLAIVSNLLSDYKRFIWKTDFDETFMRFNQKLKIKKTSL
ncbi:sensor histidine kinase [Ruminiclostridium josui]|uniref:sensor histidine kinase n=1 Tax=Ruminiclostridium josui TaxID=1499 RepID=UPI000465D720|nr:GHKL domain-containing protein [Ruminiclostridium josui]